MNRYPIHKSASIANGETTSGAVDLGSFRALAIGLPAAFDGTTITVEAAPEAEGTFQPVYDDAGTAVSLTVAAGHVVAVDAVPLAALRFVRFVAGTAQTADRTLVLYLKD